MKDSSIPKHNPEFHLQQQDNEFQILNATQQNSIFINDTAAIIWQMCTGENSIADIKVLLNDTYPDMREEIDSGVESALEILVSHKALNLK